MNTWYQMWGKTYQCQISNAGGWFIGVRFSKFMTFPWLLMIFQSSMTFNDFSRKFQFSRFSRPCGNPGDELLRRQTKFLRILSQNSQNDLKGQGQWPPFLNTNCEHPRMHVWCKFGDYSPNLWRVIVWTGKVHGQTDRHRQRQHPFGLKG